MMNFEFKQLSINRIKSN